MRYPFALLLIFGLAGRLLAVQTGAAQPVILTSSIYPDHGLPGLAPEIQLQLANGGKEQVVVPRLVLRLAILASDGSRVSIGAPHAPEADTDAKDVDTATPPSEGSDRYYWIEWEDRNFDGVVRAGQAQIKYLDFLANDFFYDRKLMMPGTYDLRFYVNIGGKETASNLLRYVVDDPAGEDRAIWAAFMQGLKTEDGGDIRLCPCLRPSVQTDLTAHPSSVYSRVWETFFPRAYPNPIVTDQDRIRELESVAAKGLPAPFDGIAKLWISGLYRSMADRAARAGNLDLAVQHAANARAVVEPLASSPDFYVRATAESYLLQGPWTKEQYQRDPAFEKDPEK